MLNSVYRDAVRRREKTLSILHDSSYESILQMAREDWTEYEPHGEDADIIGIDSSYNSVKYQGIELWVVTAVAVRVDNTVHCDLHENSLGSVEGGIAAMAGRMESRACMESIRCADLVLMDGSIHAKIAEGQNSQKKEPWYGAKNVAFVSKTSDTRERFGEYGSAAGDIFYYGKASRAPGYSSVHTYAPYGQELRISSIFLRLSESQPLLKVEVLGDGLDGGRITWLAERMYKNSVKGYPYSLRLAHQNCKIGTEDVQRIARMYGLLSETSSREVLS